VHGDADPQLRVLTPQERRVLEHIAAGLTNRQIGEEMSMAEKTVKNYVTSVLAKLGMERRTRRRPSRPPTKAGLSGVVAPDGTFGPAGGGRQPRASTYDHARDQ
jgi:DNA-binding CsgD family transcriptional regulator